MTLTNLNSINMIIFLRWLKILKKIHQHYPSYVQEHEKTIYDQLKGIKLNELIFNKKDLIKIIELNNKEFYLFCDRMK